MKRVKIVDPPSGWRYGFPKEIPEDVENLRQWFLDNGYPEKHVDLALEYSRWWFKHEEDDLTK